MLALYRSGRQAEALASYQAFRRTLADDLGMEPSASLREVERRMLRQDATLDLLPGVPQPMTVAPAEEEQRKFPSAGQGADVAHARSGDIRIAY